MSYDDRNWHDWARDVVRASLEQENESEIEQELEQVIVQNNDQSLAIVIGDDNEFDDDVAFILVNNNDQDAEQDADQDQDVDVDQLNLGLAAAVGDDVSFG